MWNPLRERERQLRTLYPDMAPEALLSRFLGKNISSDAGELQRAQWFWERRPKKLILSRDMAIWIVMFYFSLYASWILCNGQAQVTAVIVDVAWTAVAACATAAVVDIFRYTQWKLEYRSAIARLCATANRY
jgi:hypothetical protein